MPRSIPSTVRTLSVVVTLITASQAQDAARSSGWIVLPANEYRTLRQRAYPAERDTPSPPNEVALTRVEYDLRIEGQLASGRANLTVDVMNEGWVTIPLPPGLFVREALSEGKPISLVPTLPGGTTGNQLFALLSKRGRSVISLNIVLPVTATTGDERLILPAGYAGITRASITLPRQELDVRLQADSSRKNRRQPRKVSGWATRLAANH